MNVDTRLRVCQLGHHSGDEWHAKFEEYMGYTVIGDGLDHRIAGDDFSLAYSSRVAFIGRLHVGGKNLSESGKLHDGFGCYDAGFGSLSQQFL